MEMGSDESLIEHFRAAVRGAVIRGVATNSITTLLRSLKQHNTYHPKRIPVKQS